MRFQASRGGAKPRMLGASAREVPLTINGQRKMGIYEESMKGDLVARRVELPEWLGEKALEKGAGKPFLARLVAGEIRHPHASIAESQGHIFLEPDPELGFGGPAVGIDLEIWERIRRPGAKELLFAVYAPGYRRVATWRIPVAEFLEKARLVEGKGPFMAQRMVALSELKAAAGF